MMILSRCLILVFAFFSHIFTAYAEEHPIGFLLPLSGPYQGVGEDNRQGIAIAMEMLGEAAAFTPYYADSKADATSSVNEFRKLVDGNKVLASFVMRSPVGMAVNPISLSLQIPILGGVGDKRFADSNRYAFQFWPRSDVEGSFVADTLIKEEYNKIALVTSQDDWTDSVSKGFRDLLKSRGKEAVYDQEILPTDSDFRTQILQIKSKNPDVLFMNISLAQLGPFLKQLREAKLTFPVYSNFWIAKKDVVNSTPPEILNGVKFAEMDTHLPILREKLQAKFGSIPSGSTLAAYVATMMISQSLSPQIRTSAQFYEQLLKQKEIKTPDRTFIIQDRCVEYPMTIRVMKDGKAVDPQ